MKQAEKNRKSREYILAHAFAEFAAHGYGGSSLNQICARGAISKGLLYHYYAGKDDLYLACVQQLFCDMTQFLQAQIDPPRVTIAQYFSVRMQFFQQYPDHQRLFYDILMYPQSHLAQDIAQRRTAFDTFNNQVIRGILQREPLSDHITLEAALRQFRAFVNFLGGYIRLENAADAERQTSELLHTMLYGLIAR